MGHTSANEEKIFSALFSRSLDQLIFPFCDLLKHNEISRQICPDGQKIISI